MKSHKSFIFKEESHRCKYDFLNLGHLCSRNVHVLFSKLVPYDLRKLRKKRKKALDPPITLEGEILQQPECFGCGPV